MFVGLLKCADCGYPMRYQGRKYTKKDGDEKTTGAFICSYYSRCGKSACSTHMAKEEALYNSILSDIKAKAAFIKTAGEQCVTEGLVKSKNIETAENLSSYRSDLESLNARVDKLDTLTQKAYEDKVDRIILESTFDILQKNYQAEKDEKTQEITLLQQKIHAIECSRSSITAWVSLMKKYSDIERLDHAMLLDILDRVEVEESAGKRGQCSIKIFYRHIGYVEPLMQKDMRI